MNKSEFKAENQNIHSMYFNASTIETYLLYLLTNRWIDKDAVQIDLLNDTTVSIDELLPDIETSTESNYIEANIHKIHKVRINWLDDVITIDRMLLRIKATEYSLGGLLIMGVQAFDKQPKQH